MPKIRMHILSKSEAKEVASMISKNFRFKVPLDHKSKWEIIELGGELVYLVNGMPMVIESSGKLVPFLKALIDGLIELPKIIVDMGAVKHIVNGADVMVPGIVKIEGDFNKEDLVVVVDERYSKPLCVGIALLSKTEIASLSKGKVVKNIHYVGDKIWKAIKDLGLI
ncbi:MAG: DUF1947 domain-containing protein [Candidatus Nezhaarchaeales archaeon]